MAGLLTTKEFVRDYGGELQVIRVGVEPVILPEREGARLDADVLTRIEIACFTGNFDADRAFTRRFLGTALRAPNLRWAWAVLCEGVQTEVNNIRFSFVQRIGMQR